MPFISLALYSAPKSSLSGIVPLLSAGVSKPSKQAWLIQRRAAGKAQGCGSLAVSGFAAVSNPSCPLGRGGGVKGSSWTGVRS